MNNIVNERQICSCEIFTFSIIDSESGEGEFLDEKSDQFADYLKRKLDDGGYLSIADTNNSGILYDNRYIDYSKSRLSENIIDIITTSPVSKDRLQIFLGKLSRDSQRDKKCLHRIIFVTLGEFGRMEELEGHQHIHFPSDDWQEYNEGIWKTFMEMLKSGTDDEPFHDIRPSVNAEAPATPINDENIKSENLVNEVSINNEENYAHTRGRESEGDNLGIGNEDDFIERKSGNIMVEDNVVIPINTSDQGDTTQDVGEDHTNNMGYTCPTNIRIGEEIDQRNAPSNEPRTGIEHQSFPIPNEDTSELISRRKLIIIFPIMVSPFLWYHRKPVFGIFSSLVRTVWNLRTSYTAVLNNIKPDVPSIWYRFKHWLDLETPLWRNLFKKYIPLFLCYHRTSCTEILNDFRSKKRSTWNQILYSFDMQMLIMHLIYLLIILVKLTYDRQTKENGLVIPVPLPKSVPPSGLKNTKETCYMNSMMQAMASSSELDKELNVLFDQNKGNKKLELLLDVLTKINSPVGHRPDAATECLIAFMNEINWNRQSQQDTFQLLSFCINAVQRDLQVKLKTMPPKLKILHSFTEKSDYNKIQDHLGLSIPLCGEFRTKPGVDLNSLVDAFFQPSIIDDGPHSTQLYLFEEAPKILILHIQANEWSDYHGAYIKPEYHIKYGKLLEYIFDIKKDRKILDSNKVSVNYELVAVVRHMGDVTGGHYVTYRKSGQDWYLTNDEQVEAIVFNCDVIPYVLVYDKK